MKIIKILFLVIPIFLLSYSCSTVINKSAEGLEKKSKVYTVIPFENNTETPLAGLRVASIVEGVATSKGYNLKSGIYTKEQKEYSYEDINRMIGELKSSDIDYVITGSVNEFRYKTGIDGEPAVSITVKIYDVKNSKVVLVNVGSKTGWSHESIATVAQKLINELLP